MESKTNSMVLPEPVNEYRNVVPQYSEQWKDDYIQGAWSCLAKDRRGNSLPFCITISITPGNVQDMFNVVTPSATVMSVYIFKDDADMAQWILAYGPHRVSYCMYRNKSNK